MYSVKVFFYNKAYTNQVPPISVIFRFYFNSKLSYVPSFFAELFNGAIMLSGSSLDSWALTRNPLDFAKSVASSLKISTRKIQTMVDELRNRTAADVQSATSSAFNKVFAKKC